MKRLAPFLSPLLLFTALPFLFSCAATVRDPFGLALRQGAVPVFAPPESLRVDLDLVPRQKGAPPFSARLYAQPNHRYRLDAFGFSFSVAASYLLAENHWTLLLNEKREAWEGEGHSLNLAAAGLHVPDMNAMLGFLWGNPLPGFQNRDDTALIWIGDTLHWSSGGIGWQALFDSRTGTCLEAHSSSIAFKYGHYRRFENRVTPGEVEVFTNGKPLLLLRVRAIDDHPVWKRDPFVLTIPEGYSRRRATNLP